MPASNNTAPEPEIEEPTQEPEAPNTHNCPLKRWPDEGIALLVSFIEVMARSPLHPYFAMKLMHQFAHEIEASSILGSSAHKRLEFVKAAMSAGAPLTHALTDLMYDRVNSLEHSQMQQTMQTMKGSTTRGFTIDVSDAIDPQTGQLDFEKFTERLAQSMRQDLFGEGDDQEEGDDEEA